MTELLLDPPHAVQPHHDNLGHALIESRQRWRHLVTLAADLAFETDAEGRFVLMMPDPALGWPADSLIGQPSANLIADDGASTVFNPFHPAMEITRYRTWVRCADNRLAMMNLSVTPMYDAAGQIIGARGIGIDMTHPDAQAGRVASELRREQALHHILVRVGQEADTDGKIDVALWTLIHALGAEGAAVIGAVSEDAEVDILHACGTGASSILRATATLVTGPTTEPGHITNPDGRLVLAVGCETRFDTRSALAIWRAADSRSWDEEDTALVTSAVSIVRLVLEYEALQREMAHQARTDPLTGLLNRRAFIEEMHRQIARIDREAEAGTLLFVDLDAFKAVNDRLGHAAGDQVLVHLANLLRRFVRPFDLVTRLGGDEFAVWLSGADHMTAAERADFLCKTAPDDLQAILPEAFPKLGISVGIATRRTGSLESIEDLTRRADMAMYEVKRSGRRHWRVSLLDGD